MSVNYRQSFHCCSRPAITACGFCRFSVPAWIRSVQRPAQANFSSARFSSLCEIRWGIGIGNFPIVGIRQSRKRITPTRRFPPNSAGWDSRLILIFMISPSQKTRRDRTDNVCRKILPGFIIWQSVCRRASSVIWFRAFLSRWHIIGLFII